MQRNISDGRKSYRYSFADMRKCVYLSPAWQYFIKIPIVIKIKGYSVMNLWG